MGKRNQDFRINKKGVLTKYRGHADSVTVPEGVTAVGEDAFTWMNNPVSVTLPEGVISLESYSFRGCTRLRKINIPNTVSSFGTCIFRDCSELTSFVISEHHPYFQRQGPLILSRDGKQLVLCLPSADGICRVPDGVTEIRDRAFKGCNRLTDIVLPEGLTSIGHHAFWAAGNLRTISIPDSVHTIGLGIFDECTALRPPVLSEHHPYLQEEGPLIFSDDGRTLEMCLPSATGICRVPDGTESIGMSAFCSCSQLSSILLPDSVTSIDGWAFEECSSLTSMTFPENVTSVGPQMFSECCSLESLFLPVGVASLRKNALEDCSCLHVLSCPGVPFQKIPDKHLKAAARGFARRCQAGLPTPDPHRTDALTYIRKNWKTERLFLDPDFLPVILDHGYISARKTSQYLEQIAALENPVMSVAMLQYHHRCHAADEETETGDRLL